MTRGEVRACQRLLRLIAADHPRASSGQQRDDRRAEATAGARDNDSAAFELGFRNHGACSSGSSSNSRKVYMVFRPELRQNKELEWFSVSVKR